MRGHGAHRAGGPRPARRAAWVTVVGIAALGLSSCAALVPGTGGDAATLRVMAASSLTDALTEVGAAFARVRPDVDVRFSFDGSSRLAHQVEEGAPADLYVSADWRDAERLVAAGLARGPRVIAVTRLVIAVPAGNPAGITSIGDLAGAGLVVVACATAVPCGRIADRAVALAGVDLALASREQNVRAVLAKVRLGEADAGFVYAADVRVAAGEVEALALPEVPELRIEYPAVTVTGDPDRSALAAAFVDFAQRPQGRQILERHGFALP